MHIHSSFASLSTFTHQACVATIGNFDGVHMGHQKLIQSVKDMAEILGVPSTIITFNPHPEHLLKPESAPPMLMTLSSKLNTIDAMGIDNSIVLPFDFHLASMSPEEFVKEILVEKLHVCHLFIGHDYAFGKARAGNASVLKKLGCQYGFEVTQLGPVFAEDDVVSSTRIRASIMTGDLETANRLLGRPHCMEGTVIHGKKRGGKLLGFPTANVDYRTGVIMPKPGAYAIKAAIFIDENEADQSKYPDKMPKLIKGVANVGVNPTFGDVGFGIETFLFDFDEDIYDKYIKVYFYHYLRGEKKFTSVEELKKQIYNDTSTARQKLSQAAF